MKSLLSVIIFMASASVLASNYPPDYCHAVVTVCEDGPGVVAHITSGCNSGGYVIGYKKSGMLGNRKFVDAVVMFQFGRNGVIKKDFRITPDWNNLGFLTPDFSLSQVLDPLHAGPATSLDIAFSDGNGTWDSNTNSSNYYFPVGVYEAPSCHTVVTKDNFYQQVPYAAWYVINQAMRE